MYVCMYVRMYVCVCIYIYIYIYIDPGCSKSPVVPTGKQKVTNKSTQKTHRLMK